MVRAPNLKALNGIEDIDQTVGRKVEFVLGNERKWISILGLIRNAKPHLNAC